MILKDSIEKLNEATTIPSDPLNSACLVQARYKNGFKDKMSTQQVFFHKLKDATDYIVKESNYYPNSSFFKRVADALGFEYNGSSYTEREELFEQFLKDNNLGEPCGISVVFLTEGAPCPRSTPCAYLPSIKKFLIGGNKTLF